MSSDTNSDLSLRTFTTNCESNVGCTKADAHSLSNLGHGSAQHKTDSGGRFRNKRLNAHRLKNKISPSVIHGGMHTRTETFVSLTHSVGTQYMKTLMRASGMKRTFTILCTPSINPQSIQRRVS